MQQTTIARCAALRKLAGVAKSISAGDVVDYRFLREALAGLKGRR